MIKCADNKERTLVIRGKFRGRNKRDNTIKLDGIVLVGLRSVSIEWLNKERKADLIYVYNESDLDELKQIKEVYDILSNQTKDDVDDDIFDRTETDEQTENKILKSLDNKHLVMLQMKLIN